MTNVGDVLDEVREQIEADDEALGEARSRLALTREAAASFYGALRTYRSGSLAVHSMNYPVTDGDGGLVLNRNHYPALGPEGTSGLAPGDVVDDLCMHIGPIIRKRYPNARVNKSKRGPKVFFGEKINDQDPTVDLVLALTRKEGDGIWIPNLDTGKWDASHPEKHAELFNSGLAGFRSTRRKVTRLAKAWNKQFTLPGASSFEVSTWAYEFVELNMGVAKGLRVLFEEAASRLEIGDPTPDPAEVSDDLKLLIDSATMAKRLRAAADHMHDALEADGDDEVRSALSLVFWNYLEAPSTSSLKAASSLARVGAGVSGASLGVAVGGTTAAAANSRAYGGVSFR